MATPSDKLSQSLAELKKLQDSGIIAIRAGNLSRTHRERLFKNGFIQEVMKGWYISSRPDEPAGESTAWYASFWGFCSNYLSTRFGNDWCLSPEQSPYVNKLRMMWESFREPIAANFPTSPGATGNRDVYLKQIDDIYVTDAYHSLSIEGYRTLKLLLFP